MLYEYSHTNSESLAQIHSTFTERFFLGGCFLFAHPVHVRQTDLIV